jgi:hypothetical protein
VDVKGFAQWYVTSSVKSEEALGGAYVAKLYLDFTVDFYRVVRLLSYSYRLKMTLLAYGYNEGAVSYFGLIRPRHLVRHSTAKSISVRIDMES